MTSLLEVFPLPVLIGWLVAFAVFLTTALGLRHLIGREVVRRRAGAPLTAGASPSLDFPVDDTDGDSALVRRLAQSTSWLAPSDRTVLTQLRRQLMQAGYFSPLAVPGYYAARMVLALALPAVVMIVFALLPISVPIALTVIVAAWAAVAGLIVPSVSLDIRKAQMRTVYRNAFPDFIDLLVVCIEAGQSLQGALDRVSREVATYSPALSANLRIASLEVRAGIRLSDAISNLYTRVGIEEVKSLGLLLKQSEDLGTSIATSLRVFSDEMRDKRLMRAETKAHALPVKMTLPLGFFIFPVILMVIMLPVIIRIKNSFV